MKDYYFKYTHYGGYIMYDKYWKIMYGRNWNIMYDKILHDKEKNIISDPVWAANCELLMMLSDEYLTYDDMMRNLMYNKIIYPRIDYMIEMIEENTEGEKNNKPDPDDKWKIFFTKLGKLGCRVFFLFKSFCVFIFY